MPSGPGSPRHVRRIAIVIAILGLLGLVAVFVLVQRSRRGSAAALIAHARSDFEAGRYADALTGFAEAHRRLPEDPRFAQAAAESAIGAGRKAEAVLYARRAWDLGVRNENLLAMILLEPGLLESSDAETRAGILISQIEDRAAQERSRGRLLEELGRVDDAMEAWTASLAYPGGSAPEHLDEFLEILARHGKQEHLIAVCEDLRSSGNLTATGYRLLALTRAQANLSLPFTERRNPLDLLTEASERGRLDDRCRLDAVLHAWFRLDGDAVLTWASQIAEPDLAIDARLFQGLVLLERGQQEQVAALSIPDGARGPRAEGLAQALRGIHAEANLDDRLISLTKAEKLLGRHPVVSLLLARLHQMRGNLEEALVALEGIDGLAALAPTVLISRAEILAALDRLEAALGILATSERIHGSTRRSLILLERITRTHADPSLRVAVEDSLRRIQLAPPMDGLPLGGSAVADLAPSIRDSLGTVRTLIETGSFSAALEAIDRIKVDAVIASAYRTLALQGLGRSAEALACAEVARTVPQPPAITLAAAAAAMQEGLHAEADRLLTEVTAPPAARSEALRLRILGYLARGQGTEAVALLDQAEGLDAGDRAVLHALALLGEGRSDEALRHLAKARQHLLQDPLAVRMFATLLNQAGRQDEADRLLMDALDAGAPEIPIRTTLALARAHQGRYDAALSALPRGPNPAFATLRFDLLLRSGDLTAARRELDQFPSSISATDRLIARARLEQAAGRAHAAAMILAEDLNSDPVLIAWLDLVCAERLPIDLVQTHERIKTSRLRSIFLAAAAERLQRYDQAVAITRQALADHPEDPALLNNLAWYLHVSGGDADEALEYSRQAIRLAPEDANLRDTYLSICVEQGRWDDAAGGLTAAGDLVPLSPALLVIRAKVQDQAGDAEAARRSYASALDLAKRQPNWPLRMSEADLRTLVDRAP